MIKKTLLPFYVKTHWRNGRFLPVFIELSDGMSEHNSYFALSGVVGPFPGGNAYGGCGQIYGYIGRNVAKMGEIKWAKGWNLKTWQQLYDIWQEWHLKRPYEVVPEDVRAWILALPDAERKQPRIWQRAS